MNIRALKYLLPYTLPLLVAFSFSQEGWLSFLPVLYSFALIPLLELFIKPDPANLEAAEREVVKKDPFYDGLLYLVLPIQCLLTVGYLGVVQTVEFGSLSFWGYTTGLGLMLGGMGINVAHDLGHRQNKADQFLAKMLLLGTLYPHFFIEHNYGHHKNVSTPHDPATARKNESLYLFWLRTLVFSYLSAWQIEKQRLKARKKAFWSLNNEMIRFTIAEVVLLFLIFSLAGLQALVGFVLASLIGVLLLETVNYIEHYGLVRKKITEKRYENASPQHSWNSDHILGRLMLFELTRHSDHHAYPHKKYPLLDHCDESPQLPTGYPGMMLLSLVPPLWFRVMNDKLPVS